MRTRFALAAALTACILASGAASARTVKLEDKRLVLASFADCLARLGGGQSAKLLRTEPGTPEERRAMEVLGHAQSQCLTNRPVLSLQPGPMRGLVAEAMLKRQHPDWLGAAQKTPASAPVPPLRPEGAAAKPGAPVDPKRWRSFMIAYSNCLAKAEPAQVGKLLATSIDSPEERQAVLGFGDDLHDCMPFGVVYQVDVGALRSHLASALYLEFANPPQSVAAR